MKFSNTLPNTAYLSGCLVCVFRRVAEIMKIPPGDMKTKLIGFLSKASENSYIVLTLRCGKNGFCAAGRSLIGCTSWSPFSTRNFVRASDGVFLDGAMKYWNGKVKRHQYEFGGKIRIPQGPRTTVLDWEKISEFPHPYDSISVVLEQPTTDGLAVVGGLDTPQNSPFRSYPNKRWQTIVTTGRAG